MALLSLPSREGQRAKGAQGEDVAFKPGIAD
jgi:hypothetical protein